MRFSDRSFCYDGTFEGFLCVTVRCISMRIVPRDIRSENSIKDELEDYLFVRTDRSIADRMYRYIGTCSSVEVQQLSLDYFLTCVPSREMDLFIMICRAIRFGSVVGEDFVNPMMNRIQSAVRDLYREAQGIASDLDFMRDGSLSVTGIRPRNRILPLMRTTVLGNSELNDFIVYDDRHRMLLMRCGDDDRILDVSSMKPMTADVAKNDMYRRLWTYFASGEHIRNISDLKYRGADALSPMWYIAG